MADPFSVIAGAIGVIDVCIRLSDNIRQLQNDIKVIEGELSKLLQDIDGLQQLCNTVESTFISRFDEASACSPEYEAVTTNLWTHLGKALKNCLSVLAKLEAMIEDFQGTPAQSAPNAFGRTVGMVLRKKKREREFSDCRAQLGTYQNALQLVLTTIVFHDVGTSQDSSTKSFKSLSQDVQNLDSSIQLQIADLRDSMHTADSYHYDRPALAALEELQESVNFAARTISSASTNHHFDVPQSVSSIFTGREPLLRQLRDIFLPRKGTQGDQFQRRFIIHGLGGSGKTQFCCKFAQDNRDSFWGVFWIDASTSERVKQTLGLIAETAGLEKTEASALHWLSNLERRWLLIIDNADDDNVPLEKYFPKGNRGNILVTTRNPAYKVHGNVGPRYYEFRGLELQEATQLLLKASDKPTPWDKACEDLASTITKALGFLALAIVHAGAAIRDRLCSLQDYLEYYSRSRRRIRTLPLTEKSSASEIAVYATWEICYNRLEERGTEATFDALELLNILAFFHWETISHEIFTRALRNPEQESKQAEKESDDDPGPILWYNAWIDRLRGAPHAIAAFLLRNRSPLALPKIIRDAQQGSSVYDTEDRIRYALRELAQMSLIIRNDHTDSYAMHPLVHIWARERPRMKLNDQALWADVAGRVLAASILLPPLGSLAVDEKFHISLLPHIEHVQACRKYTAETMAKQKRNTIPLLSWITRVLPDLTPDEGKMRMYAKFSLVYAKCGHWESAESLLEEVAGFLCRYLGREHKRSRQVLLALSAVYWSLGRPSDAAELQQSVLDTCSSRLGPSHTDTLKAMSQLGRTRWQQGRYTAARVLQEQVLEKLLDRLPRDHADVLEAMDHLGNTVHKFWKRQHFERAFELHSEAVEAMSRVHGADHERTLIAKENLCRVSVLLGGSHLASMPRIMREVLETRRTRLGKEHPYTLLAMVNMAIILCAVGESAEAEDLIRQGLPAADRTLGRDHIGTLFGRHTLASILSQRGRYAEAKELLEEVTESQKRMASHRGDYHPDRLGALIELARCSFLLGKTRYAIEVCDEAIYGFDSISVEPHPLAESLRVARARMIQLEQGHSNDQGPSSTGSDDAGVSFPFILFRPSHDAPQM
ncbi:tetratricopeptide repeat domain-containing protein [Stachybotrys elegans]|uniref:Tetratricopeptide repeat domain-containing protein n=1 Tax=Stachybotrys elegans TaxID=80388 RepID=A0A8K0SP09_9HYPO|nr:tetratricopeptide repeat domain-containing protein [Stachybotrys elegans]